MFDFFGQLGRALQDTRFDYAELLLYAVIIGFLIILLVILVIVLPPLFAKRARKIKYFGIDLDSLEKMKNTGLISDEEYQQARQKLRQHFIKTVFEGEADAETKSELTKLLSKPSPIAPQPTDRPELIKAAPTKTEKIESETITPKAEKPKPVDLEDLLRKGLITEEEFKDLTRFGGKKE